MPIDPNMVKWDEAPKGGIDPSMVNWDEPAKPKGEISRTEKIMRGMKDPIDGGAQLVECLRVTERIRKRPEALALVRVG